MPVSIKYPRKEKGSNDVIPPVVNELIAIIYRWETAEGLEKNQQRKGEYSSASGLIVKLAINCRRLERDKRLIAGKKL